MDYDTIKLLNLEDFVNIIESIDITQIDNVLKLKINNDLCQFVILITK